ncbi:uncharacterized protein EAF01_007771 [Botrytis porri]|uniref:Myb-like domain-containing protein n=1 Tax=Botrytis porri TaxID=87229 RepID=A0A4Z1L5S3_9HELO|nr:uncharacterized protein EAF01_007771 [Botrytis porri]KAF7900469.1 hypothetical protein EAF01_007771 [Botrytis porri]TGO92125.1 hypothetical protein BPOR_0009g00040 [Botrytis porri]
MSAFNETPQLAAEARPAAPAAEVKANEKVKAPNNRTSSGKVWTQDGKDAIVVQILFQAADKNFVPNFKAIKAPGRSKKAVRHIWEALKKSHASVKDGNAKGESVAKGSSKKRKAELEGNGEGVSKKNKVDEKTIFDPEIEENFSDDGGVDE